MHRQLRPCQERKPLMSSRYVSPSWVRSVRVPMRGFTALLTDGLALTLRYVPCYCVRGRSGSAIDSPSRPRSELPQRLSLLWCWLGAMRPIRTAAGLRNVS